MNAAEAMLRASDNIARNPDSYDFFNARVPRDLSEPGCMLGKMGVLLGYPAGAPIFNVCVQTLGMYPTEFYTRLERSDEHCRLGSVQYSQDASAYMRKMALKMGGIPPEVLAIFNVKAPRTSFAARLRALVGV